MLMLGGRELWGLSIRARRAGWFGWRRFYALEKPTDETGIESRTVTIIYAYIGRAVKLHSAFYYPDNLDMLLW